MHQPLGSGVMAQVHIGQAATGILSIKLKSFVHVCHLAECSQVLWPRSSCTLLSCQLLLDGSVPH